MSKNKYYQYNVDGSVDLVDGKGNIIKRDIRNGKSRKSKRVQ